MNRREALNASLGLPLLAPDLAQDASNQDLEEANSELRLVADMLRSESVSQSIQL
jgi:hypothetical protein